VNGSAAPAAPLPRAALRLFRDGTNDVALVALKRRSSPCNGGRKSLQLGIAFELAGRFESDLSLDRADVRLPGFHREGTIFFGRSARRTLGRDGDLRFTIRNQGPSSATEATFALDLTGSARLALLERTVSPNVASCEASDATSDFSRPPPYRLVCVLTDLAPGATLPLDLRYRFHAQGSFTERRLDLAWTLESPQAPRRSTGAVTAIFCGAHARSAGCARAP
jgi:hypothetical protein